MKLVKKNKLIQAAAVLTAALLLTAALPAMAQDYPPPQPLPAPQAPPPSFSPAQLDSLVSRIALYPDPLLAQVLAAATFTDQIPDAARFADQYRNLQGQDLANVMAQANLPFDPAVQALIPFPSVLDMMAQDMNWTSQLGNAVLADRNQVMDSVQRMRMSAEQYGYLRNTPQVRVVNAGPVVEIVPVNPAFVYVPVYSPYVVFAPPRPGFFVGAAISFGPAFPIGFFGGWGWGGGFNWYSHAILVNHAVWGRTWYNRSVYVHNYGNWNHGAWRNAAVYRGAYRPDNRFAARPAPAVRGYDRPAQHAPVAPNRAAARNEAHAAASHAKEKAHSEKKEERR